MEQKRYVSIVGNIGKDPEVKQNRAGTMIEFSVAVSEGIGKYDPETKQLTVPARWYRVAVFDEGLRAEAASFTKGQRIAVRGVHSVYEWKGVSYDQIQASALARVGEWVFRTPAKKAAEDELPF